MGALKWGKMWLKQHNNSLIEWITDSTLQNCTVKSILINKRASPCYLFLATCCCLTIQTQRRDYKIQERLIISNSDIPASGIETRFSATPTSRWTLNESTPVRKNPSDWSDPRIETCHTPGFTRAQRKRAVVREEISERGKLLRVSAPWRALLRDWRSHLFRLLLLTAGAIPI